MAVRTITAPPGGGKTLNMTKLARDDFKENNKYISTKNLKKCNIYSNYPIIVFENKKFFRYLDGANNIIDSVSEELPLSFIRKIFHLKPKIRYVAFSNKIKFTDMTLQNAFCNNASFYIDEVAFIYDSQDYRDFPDCIAHFFQVHRHLSYNMIYTNSQSLSRIIKRILCISEEFWNIIEKRKFLFLTRTTFKITTELAASRNNENSLIINYTEEIYNKWFFHKKVYLAYDTKYMGELIIDIPLYDKGCYSSKKLTKNEILSSFKITSEERKKLLSIDF